MYRNTMRRLSLYCRRIELTCVRNLEYCALCLPQSSIVGHSLCCNEASTELQYSYASQKKKRKVLYTTFEKGRCDYDHEFKTASWLKCESAVEGGTKVARKLKCSVFGKFQSSIRETLAADG